MQEENRWFQSKNRVGTVDVIAVGADQVSEVSYHKQ